MYKFKVFKMDEMCEDNPMKLQQHSELACLDQGHSLTSLQVVLDVTFLILQGKCSINLEFDYVSLSNPI